MAPPHQEAVEFHLQPECRFRGSAPSDEGKHSEVMGGGYDVTEVEQGLLGHGKVYQVGLEPIKQPCKAEFVQGVD